MPLVFSVPLLYGKNYSPTLTCLLFQKGRNIEGNPEKQPSQNIWCSTSDTQILSRHSIYLMFNFFSLQIIWEEKNNPHFPPRPLCCCSIIGQIFSSLVIHLDWCQYIFQRFGIWKIISLAILKLSSKLSFSTSKKLTSYFLIIVHSTLVEC